MQISQNKVVYFRYTLKDDSGEVLDSSEGNAPLGYIHGAGNIIPGLEKALDGKSVGDKLNLSIPPEEGYGERNDALVQIVPRDAFQGVDDLQPGMQFQAHAEQGTQIVTVAQVDGDQITVDANHPLAGATLNFDVEVTEVRDATAEELDHGHVHGPDAHGHA